jgi:hypothetical protein
VHTPRSSIWRATGHPVPILAIKQPAGSPRWVAQKLPDPMIMLMTGTPVAIQRGG